MYNTRFLNTAKIGDIVTVGQYGNENKKGKVINFDIRTDRIMDRYTYKYKNVTYKVIVIKLDNCIVSLSEEYPYPCKVVG